MTAGGVLDPQSLDPEAPVDALDEPSRRRGRARGATVLFDAPGPKARRRNRLIGVVGAVVLLGGFAYVIARFASTGQFNGKKWSIFEYKAVQQTLWNGLVGTVKAAAVAGVLALVLGMVLAGGRLSERRWVRGPAFALTELFRAIPLVLLMFIFYYGLPSIGLRMAPFWAVVLALTLYNGSVLAEVFRAGIASVPRGQREAGLAIGLRSGAVLRIILLPQAIRTMLPTVISQLVVLLKDTALGYLVTYDELLKQIKQLATAPDFEFPLIPLVIVGGIVYITTCFTLSRLAIYLERRLRRGKRIAAA
jgi:glutamate transport system permease protein